MARMRHKPEEIVAKLQVGHKLDLNCISRNGCADGDSVMAKTSKSTFDLEAFLAKADGGVSISKYRKGQVVFTQGDPADTVFCIREGRVKISVLSAQGKEAAGARGGAHI